MGIDNKTNTITFLISELDRRKRKKEDWSYRMTSTWEVTTDLMILWKSADEEYNKIYKMMSDVEGTDRVQVIIVFSGLWKKGIKRNYQKVQNKWRKCVHIVCIWTVEFAAEGCHACQKVCTGSKPWKKTHLSLLNTMIRLLADEVNSPSHRSLEAGGVLGHITACLVCPYVLFHKHLLLYQYWRE